MSNRVSVSAHVDVAVPPDRAFAELIDAGGQQRWMLGTTVHPLAGTVESPAVGSRLVAFTGLAGMGVLDVMQVTVYDPDHQWVVAHEGRVIQGSGTFQVDPTPTGSRVSWTEDLTLPFGVIGRLGWPLVRPAVRWCLQRSMDKFARLFSG